ncbi:hypothetical protein BD560DRAFT_424864 [Blakeslea trispora]|nr:hypothetical protein BD560DRAFT_424864 [Blakeslea trispora]
MPQLKLDKKEGLPRKTMTVLIRLLFRRFKDDSSVPPLGDSDDDFQASKSAHIKKRKTKASPTPPHYSGEFRLLHGSKKYVNDSTIDSKQAKQNGHTEFAYVDEYRTSQIYDK